MDGKGGMKSSRVRTRAVGEAVGVEGEEEQEEGEGGEGEEGRYGVDGDTKEGHKNRLLWAAAAAAADCLGDCVGCTAGRRKCPGQ